jgi:hypothetical protein
LRLARSREAPVTGSIHKKIIVVGFGCAGALVALLAAALVLAPRPELDRPGDPALYTAEQSLAARDSLRALQARFAAPRTIGAVRSGAFWRAALTAMRGASIQNGFASLPYGDTFPAGAKQRAQWLAAARWSAVDFVLGRTPAHVNKSDTLSQSFRSDANLALSLTRALHARARLALESPGAPAIAAAAERAALLIGRGLETEPDLEHVLLGARVVRDALQFLATAPALARRVGVPRPEGALAQADSDLADLRAVRRLMGAAGSLADTGPELEAWAREPAFPVAVRREAVRSIAYGWVFNRLEPLYGLNRVRARTLETLAGLDLPPAVAAAVRDGQAVGRLGVAQRFAATLEYRGVRDAAAGL